MKTVLSPIACAVVLSLGTVAYAQEGHACPMNADPTLQAAPPGPSFLASDQIQQLLAGEGMGQAKAAEANGFPGPKHVLELADSIGLTPEQRTAVTASFERMNADVRRLGAELVQAERDLYAAFEARKIKPEEIDRLTMRIGHLQANVRARHLRAHLDTVAVLTPEQVAEYAKHRSHVH